MIININVSKLTFEKHLVKMGYNYKINYYDNFLEVLREKAFSEALLSLTKVNIKRIFFNYQDLSIINIVDYKNIKYLNKEFIVNLIDSNFLDIFLEEKEDQLFSLEIQKDAYGFSIINNLKFDSNLSDSRIIHFQYFIEKYSKFYRDTSSSRTISILKCINLNKITLSEEQKILVRKEINFYLKKEILFSVRYFEQKLENTLYVNHLPASLKREKLEEIMSKIFLDDILDETIYGLENFGYSKYPEVFKLGYRGENFEISII